MSSKKLITYTATAFMAAVVTFTACKKDDNTSNTNTPPKEDISFVTDDARLEQQFDEIQTFANQAAALGVIEAGCATVNKDTANKTIYINFGLADCLGKDGRLRRGTVKVVYTRNYADSGSVHNITFTDYFVDGNQLTGFVFATYVGKDQYHQPSYNVTIEGGMILKDGTGTISRSAARTRTWVAGAGTPVYADDVYTITGNGTFTRQDGKTYGVNIKAPLAVALTCSWIKQGVVEYSYDGKTKILDYDTKTAGCDDQATVKDNAAITNVTLH